MTPVSQRLHLGNESRVIPSLFSAFGALLGAALFNAKTWLHIQDFELDVDQVAQHLLEFGMIADLAADAQALDAFSRIGFQVVLHGKVHVLKEL